jgi:hypothetical protein
MMLLSYALPPVQVPATPPSGRNSIILTLSKREGEGSAVC